MHLIPAGNVIATYSVDEVLSPYIYVFYAAFLLSFIFTPVMRRVATHYKIMDKPDLRKMHQTPVAYLGGISVFLGWLGGLACSQMIFLHSTNTAVARHVTVQLSIIGGACLIV